jgi:multicomponent Na+:H+ antiporter subunit A
MLLTAIIVLAASGLVAPWLLPKLRHAAWFAVPPALMAAALAWQLAQSPPGGVLVEGGEWFTALGASLEFRLDAFGGLMALLATGVGALIIVFASGYLHGHVALGRFLAYLLGFMAAMLGVVVADNVILLFVFWELTSLTSYLLIGFDHQNKVARAHALQALLVTGTGGLALLAGLVLLADAAGSWRLSEIVQATDLSSEATYPAFTALILLGAMAKSAQVPLHFWLPNAMAAPTPVSAFLHSATMVKAGVFLLARLSPALDGTTLWHGSLMLVGTTTMLTGALLGLVQSDLKRILAYTTLSVLGTLTLLIGIGTPLAFQAMLVLLLGHALYKAALFMTSGTVDHEVGTRNLRHLGTLGRAMPFTAAAAMLAAFSNAGFPPFFGFLGKEYLYKTSLASDQFAWALSGAALAANLILLALALKVGWHPFWSRADAAASPTPPAALPTATVHEGPPTLFMPPLILAAAGLGLGLFPQMAADHIIGPALGAIVGHPASVKLALWQGFNLPLLLSAITITAGLLLYSQRRRLWEHAPWVEAIAGPARGYERALEGMVAFARRQTRALQSGTLSRYVFIILGSTSALLAWKFFRFGGWPDAARFGEFAWAPALLCTFVSVGAVVAASATRRLTALLALGVVGLGIALLFLHYSAPDLAITQLMVEALTVVLLLLAIDRLPAIQPETGRARRRWDALVASAFGGLLGLLALSAVQTQLAPSISATLEAWSYPQAHGRNVVNVILVDFRALDTLGEIAVLAIAGIGVAALLRKNSRPDTP